jgi:raffinose/stachyose/melibiose transport system permease protein
VKSLRKTLLIVFGAILGLLWVSPFYLMIVNSLKTQKDIFTNTFGLPKLTAFDNYSQAWQDLDFVHTFLNSLILTVCSVFVIVFFSALAAYALQRVKTKFSGFVLMLFVSAMLIPFQTIMIPLVSVFGKAQMLNMGGLVFMYLGFGSCLSIFLYHGAMKSIPTSLDEAAIIDGANRFQVYWYIILPMLKPTTVTVAVLNTMWIWNDYLLPSIVVGGNPDSQTIPLQMFNFFGEYMKKWNLGLAGLTLAIVPIIVFYFFMQRQIIRGISEGAVK